MKRKVGKEPEGVRNVRKWRMPTLLPCLQSKRLSVPKKAIKKGRCSVRVSRR